LWAYVKDQVYASHTTELPLLRAHVHDVIATVTLDVLDKTWQQVNTDLTLFVPQMGHMLKFTKLCYVTYLEARKFFEFSLPDATVRKRTP
jgi:hypothetical protein